MIRRVGKHGPGKATIATDASLVFALALDVGFAYWTTPFTGEVKRIAR